MKKMQVQLTVELMINMDEDGDLAEVIDEMDYDFTDTTGTADVQEMEIKSTEVLDSR